jgi:hypothetical protein
MATRSAGRRPTSSRRSGAISRKILGPLSVALLGLMLIGTVAARPAQASDPLPTFIPGRHVYDFASLFTPAAEARAEALATSIEAAGGGRIIVYTADLDNMPSRDTLIEAWHIDGLLLSGWSSGSASSGSSDLGTTLSGKLTTEEGDFVRGSSSGFEKMQGFTTSTLARVDGFLHHTHVFDGAGVLDTASKQKAEDSAVALGSALGGTVFVDIAETDGDPESTGFFDDLHSHFARSLVISLAVNGKQVGGYVEADGEFWDSYQTGAPWTGDTMSAHNAPGSDVRAEMMKAILAVELVPSPVDAVGSGVASMIGWIHDSITSFFADETNVRASLGGLLVAILALAGFWLTKRLRRRDRGYADDDSVMLPAPPAEMTPALAALVAAPLNSTRAVTVALLDLAAHGRIAFYGDPGAFGSGAGIRVLSGASNGGAASGTHHAQGESAASSRALGPAEEKLLEGLVLQAGGDGAIAPVGFGELRPLFERTAEQLEQEARQRGWLNLQSRSVSVAWSIAGGALLAGAAIAMIRIQPIAALTLGIAGLSILPAAQHMPLPLRTADGVMTRAMVEAYKRTLRRALAGEPGTVPPWLANAEEAALWGYAWGLEGEVQAFVGRNVGAAMGGFGSAGGAASTAGDMTSIVTMLQGLAGMPEANPVGLDTDAIASTLGGLGRKLVIQTEDATPQAEPEKT